METRKGIFRDALDVVWITETPEQQTQGHALWTPSTAVDRAPSDKPWTAQGESLAGEGGWRGWCPPPPAAL